MLKQGMKAPEFTLKNQDSKTFSLQDFAGRKIVLYFYPQDDTPGCTSQACAFAGAYAKFRDIDVTVIGISQDSVESHEEFAKKYNLPFTILADPDHQAINAYDVWQEKERDGIKKMGVVRTTYIIDEEGNIELVMENAQPDTNAADILNYLKA